MKIFFEELPKEDPEELLDFLLEHMISDHLRNLFHNFVVNSCLTPEELDDESGKLLINRAYKLTLLPGKTEDFRASSFEIGEVNGEIGYLITMTPMDAEFVTDKTKQEFTERHMRFLHVVNNKIIEVHQIRWLDD